MIKSDDVLDLVKDWIQHIENDEELKICKSTENYLKITFEKSKWLMIDILEYMFNLKDGDSNIKLEWTNGEIEE